jgi:hypothetical protein
MKWIELTLHGGKRTLFNFDRVVAVEDQAAGALLVIAGRPSPMQVQQSYDEVMERLGDKAHGENAAGEIGKFSRTGRQPRG